MTKKTRDKVKALLSGSDTSLRKFRRTFITRGPNRAESLPKTGCKNCALCKAARLIRRADRAAA